MASKIKKKKIIKNYKEVFLREREKNMIDKFLKDKNYILSLCGRPGIGKTATVLHVLKNKDFYYYNYLEKEDEWKSLMKIKAKIVVFDEFDKFFEKSSKNTTLLLNFFQKNKKKLIVIANSLDLITNSIIFGSYTSQELYIIIQKILQKKNQTIKEDELIYISKKFATKSDFREIETYLENYKYNMISDCTYNENDCNSDDNLYHRIIKNILNETNINHFRDKYAFFLKECKKMNLPNLNRSDFLLLFGMYK